jgi:hypothetical protein
VNVAPGRQRVGGHRHGIAVGGFARCSVKFGAPGAFVKVAGEAGYVVKRLATTEARQQRVFLSAAQLVDFKRAVVVGKLAT